MWETGVERSLAGWTGAGAGLGLALGALASWLIQLEPAAVWLAGLGALALGGAGYLVGWRRAATARERALAAEVERLTHVNASITEAMAEGLVLEDAAGRLTLVNPTLLKLLDYSADELLGQHWSKIVAAESRAVVAEHTAQRPGGVASSYEARLLAKDGYEIPVLVSAMPLRRDGQYAGTLAVLVNIADRLRIETQLQRANDYLSRSLAELQQRSHEMRLVNELNDRLQTCVNIPEAHASLAPILARLFPDYPGAFYHLAGDGTAELVTAWGAGAAWAAAFASDTCWGLRRARANWSTAGQPDRLCRHLTPAEAGAPATLCVPLVGQGEAVGLLCLQLPATEVAAPGPQQRLAQTVADSLALALANLQLRDTLRQQSIRDPLTGLFNRRYMEESFERELRRATRRADTVGVIMLDIDHFKHVNDSAGHAAGDRLLRAVADCLSLHTRASDVVCRYGGEEFVLILPEASLESTRQRAEHLRTELSRLRPDYHGQRLGPVTASAGVAAFPTHGPTVESLLSAADQALYEAKHQGRDRVISAPLPGPAA